MIVPERNGCIRLLHQPRGGRPVLDVHPHTAGAPGVPERFYSVFVLLAWQIREICRWTLVCGMRVDAALLGVSATIMLVNPAMAVNA